MAPMQAAAPASSTAEKGYDPEIKDMADYIHNYKVDSDLAVWSFDRKSYGDGANYWFSTTLHAWSFLIPLVVDWKL